MTKLVAVGLLAGSLFGGCLNGYPEAPHEPGAAEPEPVPNEGDADPFDVPDDGDPSDYVGALDVSQARLSGDMGDVHGFSGDATSTSGYQDYSYANITVTTTSDAEQYSAMAILDVEGGLDHPSLVPGANLHFDGYEGSDGLYMYLTGCSGQREGSWVFDAGADDLTVQVGTGSADDRIRVDFDATFTGNGTTHGTFEVTVPQT